MDRGADGTADQSKADAVIAVSASGFTTTNVGSPRQRTANRKPQLTDLEGKPPDPLTWRLPYQSVMQNLDQRKWTGVPADVNASVATNVLVNRKPRASISTPISQCAYRHLGFGVGSVPDTRVGQRGGISISLKKPHSSGRSIGRF